MPIWNLIHTVASTTVTRLRQERGQALVEFAVVLPVLMLLILGILYFGRYESYSSQMTQLSEEGVRDAAVGFAASASNGSTCSTGGTPNPSIACYIQNQASGELAQGSSDVAKVTVWVDCNPANVDSSCNAGENVAVCLQTTVNFPYAHITGATIYQSATMRVETTAAVTSSYTGTNSTAPC